VRSPGAGNSHAPLHRAGALRQPQGRSSYAPALFARENTAAKLASKDQDRRKALEAAKNRLFEAKKIKVENYGKPSPYNKIVEIVVPPEREG